ncbi:hypothetical protein AB6N23_03795 [Cellulomonas sp. 179-A 9B4 NHS]|uniref:hypothetical protein n=1 Tax=Cellulomonas sp. 179-A 9B4 NHS TaxID=3142379 RepID=UPI0039A0A568
MDEQLEPVEPEVTLVPLDEHGRVAVVAADVERARDVVHRLGATLPVATTRGEGAAATYFGGAALVGAQGIVAGVQGLQGVVQLAPETLALLHQGGHLMMSHGQMLGNVVGANGTIVANAAFVPVSAATSMATLVATLGPAVALVAIQVQLGRIQKAVDQVGRSVDLLLSEAREYRSADVETRIDRVARESARAVELGRVPTGMLDELRGDGHALEAYCRATAHTIDARLRQLGIGRDRGASVQKDVLLRDAASLLRDTVNLHAAAECWFVYELLRAATLRAQDHEYADAVVDSASARSDAWRTTAAEQTAVLQRRLRQVAAAPGKALDPRTKRRVAAIAQEVADAVVEAMPTTDPALPAAELTVGLNDEHQEQVLQELRWRTEDGPLILLAGVSVPRVAEVRGIDVTRGAPRAVAARDGFIAVGTHRVVVAIVKEFVADGSTMLDAPRTDCGVSTVESATGQFSLQVIDGESVRVVPHEAQRRLAPSLMHRHVGEALARRAPRGQLGR